MKKLLATTAILFSCALLALAFSYSLEGRVVLKSPTDTKAEFRASERRRLDPGALTSAITTNEEEKRLDTSFDMKIGFLFNGPTDDYGFTYSQNQGRLALAEALGVETVAMENLPSDERVIDHLQKLIEDGCRVIFACSSGFLPYAIEMAERHPDVYFFNCGTNETRANLSSYFGRIYQIRYLTGIVAGLRTETNRIGYIAAQRDNAQVLRGINAFALGVKRANPEAKIAVKWSGVWYDPALERALAHDAIHEGCDVIAQHQNSVGPQIAAEELAVWSVGYHASMEFFAPRAYLTGAVWNWAPYMIDQVRKIANGTWQSENYWGGVEDDIVRLEPLTAQVVPGTAEMVAEAEMEIRNGFSIFEGPIYDNRGNLQVPAGRVLTDEEMHAVDWLADNVICDEDPL